jgi:O-antigen/teichoic acid export membrane protein
VTALFVAVPRLGIYGAILALALGALTRLGFGLFFARRFYRVRFEWRKIILLTFGAMAVFFLARAVPVAPSAAGLGLRLAVLACYPLATGWWLLGGRRPWLRRNPR